MKMLLRFKGIFLVHFYIDEEILMGLGMEIGIDLGTSSVLIYVRGKGVVPLVCQ